MSLHFLKQTDSTINMFKLTDKWQEVVAEHNSAPQIVFPRNKITSTEKGFVKDPSFYTSFFENIPSELLFTNPFKMHFCSH